MAEHIIPTDKPVRWTVVTEDAEPLSGITELGDKTAAAYTVYYSDDENDYIASLPVARFPVLPDSGYLEAGDIYDWNGQAVMVRQSHSRTIYTPDATPALFLVHREGAGVLEWVAGEQVLVGMRRLYGDAEYECIQAHVSQTDWTPPATPALWRVSVAPSVEWQAGVKYAIGDVAQYNGVEYRCRQAHTAQVGWEPPKVPALWTVSTN